MTNINGRPKLIVGLNDLYVQNLDFLSSVESSGTNKYNEITMEKFRELNDQLKIYIDQLKNGIDCNKSLSYWCTKFANVLLSDANLKDKGE